MDSSQSNIALFYRNKIKKNLKQKKRENKEKTCFWREIVGTVTL